MLFTLSFPYPIWDSVTTNIVVGGARGLGEISKFVNLKLMHVLD